MELLVQEVYRLLENSLKKRCMLILLLIITSTAICSIFLGNPFIHYINFGMSKVKVKGWIMLYFPQWAIMCMIWGIIGGVYEFIYKDQCIKKCTNILLNECDSIKMLELARYGCQYGKETRKYKELLCFEKMYVWALNENFMSEKAMTYLLTEWESNRGLEHKRLMLQINLSILFEQKKDEDFLLAIRQYPKFQKNSIVLVQESMLCKDYYNAIEILKKTKCKTKYEQMKKSYYLAECYASIGLSNEAKKEIQHVLTCVQLEEYIVRSNKLLYSIKNKI